MTEPSASGWKTSRLILLAAAALALIAIVYAVTRSNPALTTPEPPDNAASAAAGEGDAEAVIRSLQDRVGANPKDAGAWRALGQAYFMTERYDDSLRAYRRATELEPEDAAVWSAFGEAAVMASAKDPMPGEALAAFQKAHELDPKDARARYFLAVARDLKGEHKGAIDDWFALLADSPADAPWVPDLRRTIEQVAAINKIDVADRLASTKTAPPKADPTATAAIPGPTRDQMQAAAALPKGAQDQMIAGMVDGLEAKLKSDPANVDGWIMLMRSRMTLGEAARAAAARDSALAANPAAADRIKGAARTLGVPGS